MAKIHIPTYDTLMNPTLQAIKLLGGSGTIEEIDNKVADIAGLSDEQLNFSIPYEFMGVGAHYEPDYLVRLAEDTTLILEIKGMETEQDRAKHEAAKKWVSAVNNWGKLGKWMFHVNKDPQVLGRELGEM